MMKYMHSIFTPISYEIGVFLFKTTFQTCICCITILNNLLYAFDYTFDYTQERRGLNLHFMRFSAVQSHSSPMSSANFLDLSEKTQVLLFSTVPSVSNGFSDFKNCFSKVYKGTRRSFGGTKNGVKVE